MYPRRSVTREQKAYEAAAGPIAEAELLAGLDPVTPWGEHLVLQPHLRAPFSGCVVAAAGAGLVSPAPS